MKPSRLLSLTALFLSALLIVGCAESPPTQAAPTSSASPEETLVSSAESEEIIVPRTPEPTTTPSALHRSINRFGQEAGLDSIVVLGLTGTDWLNLGVSILIVIAGYGIGGLVARALMPRLSRRVPAPYEQDLREVVNPKIRQLFRLFALWFATRRLDFVSAEVKSLLGDIYFVSALIVSTQIGFKLIDLAQEYYTDRIEPQERKDELSPIISLLARIAYAGLIVLSLTAVLSRFGVNITAFAAAVGIAGLGFALAAQDTIADAIAGMLILADRPFRVGDRIEIEAIDAWGDVVDIGFRTTRIRTRDNRLVIVPNSTISKNEIINYSYPDPRYRIETHIGIAYGSDIEHARQVIVDTVRGVEGVLLDKPVEALYIEMADSHMKFRVRWWIDSYVDTRRMFDKVHTALQNALDEAGVVMPYPIQELHHRLTSEQKDELTTGIGKPTDLESPVNLED